MRSAWVLLALTGVAHGDGRAKVDALADIAQVTHGSTRVVIKGDARARDVVPVVEHILEDVARRFTRSRKDRDPDLTLCAMTGDRGYFAVANAFGDPPSDLGFYLPDHRVAFANLGRSIGNLRHELVHPLLGDDFPAIPAWLTEGIAALYGSSRWGKHGFEFLVNYRLRDLQRALADDTLPSLAELALTTPDDVRGQRGMMWYGYARYVLLYAERRGDLDRLYADLRDASGDAERQRDVLLAHVDERAFRAWAKRLRY